MKVTQNGVYPKCYIFSEDGAKPKVYKTEHLSTHARQNQLFPLMAPSLHPNGAFVVPVEQKLESVVIDLSCIRLNYPGYADLIMRKIENRECTDTDNEEDGMWFCFLYDIADHHSSVLSMHCKPRFGRPSWNWDVLHQTIVGDLMELFEDWYSDVCKPNFENKTKMKPVHKTFFIAMEIMLKLLDTNCDEKWELVEESWASRAHPDRHREGAALSVLGRHQTSARRTVFIE